MSFKFSKKCLLFTLTATLLFASLSCPSSWGSEPVGFNAQVRAIFSDKCYQCHGPDEGSREAGLRLDTRSGAVADLGGYAAIVPGEPDASAVVERIGADDPNYRMPPPVTNKQLTDEEKKLIARWIEQGAAYDAHWSFLPIEKGQPPEISESSWVRNPIDQFILAKLQRRQIQPSPQADPNALIKRLSIDLTGLLPSPARTRKFVDDFRQDDEAAVEQLVDELLASPHYAERWARHWLDQARYADSHGYTIDGDRVMWPYRDWVIQAIHEDMPFDQFTIEQIAGDLLPSPTKSQLVATGFHRNTLINQEGGTDNEQFRNEAVVDRVNTTGAVWLGLTVGCAQCHSHKFDPISHQEYYELFAFFNHGQDQNNIGPTVEVRENELFLTDPDRELAARLEEAKQEVAALEKSQSARQSDWEAKTLERLGAETRADWQPVHISTLEAAGGAPLKTLDDGSILAGKGAGKETYTVTCDAPVESIAAVRLRVIPHESLPKNGPGLAGNGNFVLTGFEMWHGDDPIPFARAVASHEQPGYPIASVIGNDKSSGWAINVGKGTPAGIKMNSEHQARFILAEPLAAGDRPVRFVLRHERNDAFYNIGRFAVEVSSTPPSLKLDEALLAALRTPRDKRTKEQKARLAAEFAKADAALQAARARLAKAHKSLGLGASARSMVMRELPQPRETYIHIRGDFLRKDKQTGLLQPGVPGVLPPFPKEGDGPATRLELAKWLVSPDNPLTARVIVNRMWMRLFGRGLVETENDFGSQGASPTHPRLLDWLARSFMENGWSRKQLLKLIVTSAAYRQSSHYRNDLKEIDGANRLLARQNRLRYQAEIIRDAALSASGMLQTKIGGPSVRPPQPDGVYAFTQTKKSWVADTGPDRYRRTMYTRFYRSAPYPLLTTFDAPDFQSVCTRRPRSNTPLQSLTMANDVVFFELAQGLASRLMKQTPGSGPQSNRQRIGQAFAHCFCRQPTPAEAAAVEEYFQSQAKGFEKDVKAAQAVAPESIPKGFNPAEAAAWTAVARSLMNTDEFITRE